MSPVCSRIARIVSRRSRVVSRSRAPACTAGRVIGRALNAPVSRWVETTTAHDIFGGHGTLGPDTVSHIFRSLAADLKHCGATSGRARRQRPSIALPATAETRRQRANHDGVTWSSSLRARALAVSRIHRIIALQHLRRKHRCQCCPGRFPVNDPSLSAPRSGRRPASRSIGHS